MTAPSNFNSVTMLPGTSYFYQTAPPQSSTKWLTTEGQNSDGQIPTFVGSSGFRALPTAADPLKYPADVRWPSEFPYQIPGFHQAAAAAAAAASATPSAASEAYPTDPFPSTSMGQLPGSCCLNRLDNNGSCYYPNAMLTAPYAGTATNEHFAAAEHIAHWKVPAFAYTPLEVRKSGTDRVHHHHHQQQQQQITSPPYRTGPGTNNVRVRTSEKYRMVYTDYQRLELEKEFRTSQFINSERKSQLSSELQLTERQIKIWFQNRRAKDRRENKKTRLV